MKFIKQRWPDILVATIAGILVLLIPTIVKYFFTSANIVMTMQIMAILIIVASIVFNFLYCRDGMKQNNKENSCLEEYHMAMQLCKEMGIVKVLPSTVKDEGGTESILSECNDHFSFMGIAATKWVQAPNFDITMKKILARNGTIRFVILNPMSIAARNMSIASEKSETYLQELIIENIKKMKKYHDMGLNIHVKLYSHMPVFRIAIADNGKIYLGHYRINNDGSQLQQLVLQGKDKVLFAQFSDYFNTTWDDPDLKSLDFDKIGNQEYLKAIGGN